MINVLAVVLLALSQVQSAPQYQHSQYGEIGAPLLVSLSHIRPPYFSSGENQEGVQAALCKYPVLEIIISTTTVAQEKIGSQCLYFSSPFQPWGITETWEEVGNISLSNYPVTRVIYGYLGLQRLL